MLMTDNLFPPPWTKGSMLAWWDTWESPWVISICLVCFLMNSVNITHVLACGVHNAAVLGFFFSCTDAVISFIPFSSRRKTQQFLHMQSKGSSFRPSARDGGLLDPMKTLKSPKPKPPVLRETPTAPHNPPVDTLPNPTRFPLPPSHATAVTRITVWLYFLPKGACCRDTEPNWPRQSWL